MLRGKWVRRIVIISILLIALLVVAYFVGGYVIYDQLTAITPNCEVGYMEGKRDNTPANFVARFGSNDPLIDDTPYRMPEFETVTFSPRNDNLRLEAWFILANNESDEVIIVVHGIHSCRRDSTVLLPAGMLHRNGFNVLMLDLRNHGQSEIEDGRTSVGNREHLDVLGAFDWLQEQGFDTENIGIVGISLGGGVSIIAFGEEATIPALWVDSTYADINDVVEAELERNSYPVILAQSASITSQAYGVSLSEYSPLESMANYAGRPVFITHGTGDTRLSVDYAYDLFAATDDTAELWILDDFEHVEAIYNARDEYEERLVTFFGEALGE